MKQPVVIVGIGQLGGVFARGFLRSGHPVYPITRDMDMAAEAEKLPEPELVLVATAEGDMHAALEQLPGQWREQVGLLQNELLPRDWLHHGLPHPTVAVVWFEKKPGQEAKVLVPTPVYGPAASTVVDALEAIEIPTRRLDDEQSALYEMVLKNVYILTTNIAGLRTGGTVRELEAQHRRFAEEVATEIIRIQEWLTDQRWSEQQLIEDMYRIFEADPEHKCTGRSAPARLERALAYADRAGLDVATLREIHHQQTGG